MTEPTIKVKQLFKLIDNNPYALAWQIKDIIKQAIIDDALGTYTTKEKKDGI